MFTSVVLVLVFRCVVSILFVEFLMSRVRLGESVLNQYSPDFGYTGNGQVFYKTKLLVPEEAAEKSVAL
jgi:hypothetical protein